MSSQGDVAKQVEMAFLVHKKRNDTCREVMTPHFLKLIRHIQNKIEGI